MIVRSILSFIFNLIPIIEMPEQIMGVFNNVGTWVATVNHYIPVDTFLICISLYFTVWLGCALMSAFLQLL